MTTTATIALLGALDTKGTEYGFVRDQLHAEGCDALLIDTGVLGEPQIAADISRRQVAATAGASLDRLQEQHERGPGMKTMADGAALILEGLVVSGDVDGTLALGGSNAAYIFAAACARLPLGLPKVLVSTMATGDTRPYVGHTDMILVNPVVDINGLNRISKPVLANAAKACAGMVRSPFTGAEGAARAVAVSMFGVTTPCGAQLATQLEQAGLEPLTFHCTGTGGQTMEELIRSGTFAAVADMTTTELADDLVGGVCSAGPERLTAAGKAGIPQVVSLGALDMVNFGPASSVPAQFANRLFHEHNPEVTLMRTTKEESAELGRHIAEKLNTATAPVTVLIPAGGFSMLSTPGEPFHDPAADAALIDSLTAGLRDTIDVRTFECDINDPAVAEAAADVVINYMGEAIND
ncbi:Tm-1-like ATP-binding domain-containing protein [Arthrobacter castelli]|uniref:Tm-1-like ATP-binding domain-containing protein n=1 Tax=Arthrobacter castelli TaxID=271431 RepID=UPI00040E1961|nr:Tm-1-like ATP-binding domain-containing protein [Arthrobacter castelli]